MRKAVLPALLLLAPGCKSQAPEPLLVLPEFTMTAVGPKGERPFGRKDLEGSVWLVDFVFTRCGGPCPMMTQRFAHLRSSLPREARLLSVTVDPEYDTPERLRRYAGAFGADLDRWVFLRGSTADTYRLLFAGFRQPMSSDPNAPPESRVQHSTRFALVDKKGGVRRFFDALADGEDAAIVEDARTLLEEPST